MASPPAWWSDANFNRETTETFDGLSPMGGGIAAWCPRDRPPRRWLRLERKSTVVSTGSLGSSMHTPIAPTSAPVASRGISAGVDSLSGTLKPPSSSTDPMSTLEKPATPMTVLYDWWIELAWKDSMCLRISPLIRGVSGLSGSSGAMGGGGGGGGGQAGDDGEQKTDEEKLFEKIYNARSEEDVLDSIPVACKVISFEEYEKVAMFLTFRDVDSSVHFLVLWAPTTSGATTGSRKPLEVDYVEPSRMHMAVDWVTRQARKMVFRYFNTIFTIEEEQQQAGLHCAELAKNFFELLLSQLSHFCYQISYPLMTPPVPSRREINEEDLLWVRDLAEVARVPYVSRASSASKKASREVKLKQQIVEVVFFSFSFLRPIIVSNDGHRLKKYWLKIISLFFSVHRAHNSSRETSDLLTVGLQLQGLNTGRKRAAIESEALEILSGLPSSIASCILFLDSDAQGSSDSKYDWVSVSDGRTICEPTEKWKRPTDFSPHQVVIEGIEMVMSRMKSFVEMYDSHRVPESALKLHWDGTMLMVQQWRQELYAISEVLLAYRKDMPSENESMDAWLVQVAKCTVQWTQREESGERIRRVNKAFEF